MPPPVPFLTVLTFLPLFYASIFLHELGHAVAGRAVGFVVTSFGLGMARPWLVIKCGRMKIFFCWVHPFQGLTFVVMPQLYPSKGRKVLFAAGGILANALGAVLALALWRWCSWGRGEWLMSAAVNGLIAGISLIPIQTRVGQTPFRTDGVLILAALRSTSFRPPAPMLIQSVNSLRRLWESIGDHLQMKLGLLGAAESYAELGDFERAEHLRVQGESLPPFEGPIIPSAGAVLQGVIASGTGRIEEATEALDRAEAYYRSGSSDFAVRRNSLLRTIHQHTETVRARRMREVAGQSSAL
jgi:peptidase M50-like protein